MVLKHPRRFSLIAIQYCPFRVNDTHNTMGIQKLKIGPGNPVDTMLDSRGRGLEFKLTASNLDVGPDPI